MAKKRRLEASTSGNESIPVTTLISSAAAIDPALASLFANSVSWDTIKL